MNRPVKAREFIGVPVGFNPDEVDVTEIESLSCEIPRIESADINTVEVLAARFLAGADRCSDLMAKAERWTGYTKSLREKEHSEACIQRSGESSNAAQKVYATGDEKYVKASNTFITAAAFTKWVERKHDSLMTAHYLCKELMKRFRPGEQASGWGDAPEGAFK
jgi:hypothetical protein